VPDYECYSERDYRKRLRILLKRKETRMYKCKGCEWKGETPVLSTIDRWGIVIGENGKTCPECGNEVTKER